MMDENNNVKNIIDNIIGTDTSLRKKRKSPLNIKKEQFIRIISSLNELIAKDIILNSLGVDLTSYSNSMYNIIDDLIEFYFGKDLSKLIFFYLYDRINEDGSINELYNDKNEKINLDSPLDLWNLIEYIENHKKK